VCVCLSSIVTRGADPPLLRGLLKVLEGGKEGGTWEGEEVARACVCTYVCVCVCVCLYLSLYVTV
jgi:hypothetical protein